MPTSKPHTGAASSCPSAAIVAEVGEAWLAAKEGRSHPRIISKTPEQRKQSCKPAATPEMQPVIPNCHASTYQNHGVVFMKG
ncbi:hypothetical protein ACFFW8_20705 [Erwinia tracheiphila]